MYKKLDKILNNVKPIFFCFWILTLFLNKEYKISTFFICLISLYFLYDIKKNRINNMSFYIKNTKSVIISILLFLILNTISVFFIDYTEHDIGYLKDFIKYSLFLFVPIIIIKNKIDIKNFLIGFVVVNGIFCIYGLYMYFVLNYSRIGEIPTLFSLLVLFLMPFSILPYLLWKNKMQFLFYILMCLNLIVLILTQTRASLYLL